MRRYRCCGAESKWNSPRLGHAPDCPVVLREKRRRLGVLHRCEAHDFPDDLECPGCWDTADADTYTGVGL